MTEHPVDVASFVDEHFYAGERLGYYAPAKNGTEKGFALITDRRIVFYSKGVFSESIKQMPLEEVRQISSSAGVFAKKLKVGEFEFRFRTKEILHTFENVLCEAKQLADQGSSPSGDPEARDQAREQLGAAVTSNTPNGQKGMPKGEDHVRSESQEPWWERNLLVAFLCLLGPFGVIGAYGLYKRSTLSDGEGFDLPGVISILVGILSILPLVTVVTAISLSEEELETNRGNQRVAGKEAGRNERQPDFRRAFSRIRQWIEAYPNGGSVNFQGTKLTWSICFEAPESLATCGNMFHGFAGTLERAKSAGFQPRTTKKLMQWMSKSQQKIYPELRDRFGPVVRRKSKVDGLGAKTIGASYKTIDFWAPGLRKDDTDPILEAMRGSIYSLRFETVRFRTSENGRVLRTVTFEAPEDAVLARFSESGDWIEFYAPGEAHEGRTTGGDSEKQKNENTAGSLSVEIGETFSYGDIDATFNPPVVSKRNGDDIPATGAVFLTAFYTVENNGSEELKGLFLPLKFRSGGGTVFKNRNQTGDVSFVATYSPDQKRKSWVTFEIPKSVLKSDFRLILPASDSPVGRRVVVPVKPSQVKYP